MSNALFDIQSTFILIDQQYSSLLAACTTPAQQDMLAGLYAAAKNAYVMSTGSAVLDDDPEVAKLSHRLKAANDAISRSLATMGSMDELLDDMRDAVSIGAQLMARMGPGPGH